MSDMFPHVFTIFNLVDEDSNEYEKSTIRKSLFVNREATNRNKTGLVNADAISVYISLPVKEYSGKKQVTPQEFDSLSQEDKKSKFCYRKGDFISFGDITLDNLSVNEYKNKYGNIYEITGVSEFNYGGLPVVVLSAK